MLNLDQLAAKTAQAIVEAAAGSPKELDILVTKTLGVLQENGVYAAVLFLQSRTQKKEKELAPKIEAQLFSALSDLLPESRNAQDKLQFVADNIAGHLDTLLLVKQLWEQILIYTRYGAKAAQASQSAAASETSPAQT